MKKLLVMVMAATFALTTLVATATTAEAKHRHGDRVWPFVAGGVLGFGLGYGLAPRRQYAYPPTYYPAYPRAYYPRPYAPNRLYRARSQHVQWCSWRYRTYNPATDTFFIRRGVPAYCVSPYRRPY
jgi:hypothetical protein